MIGWKNGELMPNKNIAKIVDVENLVDYECCYII